ncbi:MAG TPA: acetate/propionate family kinase, partial [Candidatus Eisenbacteria bacterium]|nr:acetate/propionate family kinase [Candidatus Eisenbacteria bacterium]
MNVLVLNCGSSSLRFQVIDTDLAKIEKDQDHKLASGRVERIGSEALIDIEVEGKPRVRRAEALRDHKAALDAILPALSDIDAVGHRVVHGGERLTRSVLIDASVIEGIEECIELAPLHNPANLKGIRAATERFGSKVPQAAVFDTSFHATMPETSYLYALPYWTYVRHKIRRYGFHGTSHRYVAYRYRKLMGKRREDVKLVTLHLGNGCSACAIEAGRSVDTSMGLTPLEGLIMGTRSGDLDPSILDFLAQKEGMGFAEIDALLNKQSGLLGISGLTGDMRDLLAEEAENGDRRARLAIELFCLRVRKYIGAYWACYGADAV